MGYIVAHCVVALFSVRYWPFTDYPMFNDPIYSDDEIFVYKYYGINVQGHKVELPRNFLKGFGIGELNITNLYLAGKKAQFEDVIKDWLNSEGKKIEIESVQFVKVEVKRPIQKNLQDSLIYSEIINITKAKGSD